MSFLSKLFPRVSREFPGMRWLNISLRSLHLVGMAGMAGHYLYMGPGPVLFDFWALTLLSGGGLLGLAVWSDGRWLLQLRGMVILLKLLLLWSLPWLEGLFSHGAAWGFVAIILLSSVIAHAPARVRCRMVVHLQGIAAL